MEKKGLEKRLKITYKLRQRFIRDRQKGRPEVLKHGSVGITSLDKRRIVEGWISVERRKAAALIPDLNVAFPGQFGGRT